MIVIRERRLFFFKALRGESKSTAILVHRTSHVLRNARGDLCLNLKSHSNVCAGQRGYVLQHFLRDLACVAPYTSGVQLNRTMKPSRLFRLIADRLGSRLCGTTRLKSGCSGQRCTAGGSDGSGRTSHCSSRSRLRFKLLGRLVGLTMKPLAWTEAS